VNGENIQRYSDKTVEECADICNADSLCLGFEYGVAYGGSGRYETGDCQKSSSTNLDGCDGAYHNLDFYTKTTSMASRPLS